MTGQTAITDSYFLGEAGRFPMTQIVKGWTLGTTATTLLLLQGFDQGRRDSFDIRTYRLAIVGPMLQTSKLRSFRIKIVGKDSSQMFYLREFSP